MSANWPGHLVLVKITSSTTEDVYKCSDCSKTTTHSEAAVCTKCLTRWCRTCGQFPDCSWSKCPYQSNVLCGPCMVGHEADAIHTEALTCSWCRQYRPKDGLVYTTHHKRCHDETACELRGAFT